MGGEGRPCWPDVGTMFYACNVRLFLRGKPLGQIRNFAEIPDLSNLKWVWVEAWNSEKPMDYIPDFREDAVSSSAYPIDKESICFTYCIWKRLMMMIEKAQLLLPRAKKIIPAVVAKWNCCKGCIDEMTRHLDETDFIFRRGTPK